MHTMKLTCLAALAATAILGSAHAQLNPYGGLAFEPELTSDDLRMVLLSGDAVNQIPSPTSGETRAWNNPQSGNSGAVTLESAFRTNDMSCHRLRYSITMSGQETPQTYFLTWCQTPTGDWKIKS